MSLTRQKRKMMPELIKAKRLTGQAIKESQEFLTKKGDYLAYHPIRLTFKNGEDSPISSSEILDIDL